MLEISRRRNSGFWYCELARTVRNFTSWAVILRRAKGGRWKRCASISVRRRWSRLRRIFLRGGRSYCCIGHLIRRRRYSRRRINCFRDQHARWWDLALLRTLVGGRKSRRNSLLLLAT